MNQIISIVKDLELSFRLYFHRHPYLAILSGFIFGFFAAKNIWLLFGTMMILAIYFALAIVFDDLFDRDGRK